MGENGRVIVGCTHGEEDPDRVTVAYLTATAALDRGKEVLKRATPLMEFADSGAMTFNY